MNRAETLGELCTGEERIEVLGNTKGEAPSGILLMDHETFDLIGRWE
jgi:hypothetical protein